jgi:hypothetical protein
MRGAGLETIDKMHPFVDSWPKSASWRGPRGPEDWSMHSLRAVSLRRVDLNECCMEFTDAFYPWFSG